MAAAWYDHDWAELPEIAFLKKHKLKPGASVFDLGAHQGIVAMMLALECSPSGKVVAVEGTRHNAEQAVKNFALNSVSNVTLIHAIVGDTAGGEVFFSNTLNGAVTADGIGEAVKTVTIDSLSEEHGCPDLVFLDIEGFECHALAGAGRTLANGVDFCIEVHEGCGLQDHGDKEAIMACFPPSSYRCFISFPEGGDFKPWSSGDALPEDRFWLVALSNRSSSSPS